MADQQAGSNPPEPKSYDADVMDDARAAFDEVSKGTETVAEPEPKAEVKAEPEVKPEPVEAKADHPTDPNRYADGTFKPTKEEADAQKAEPQAKSPAEVKAVAETEQPLAQPAAVVSGPPGGFSPRTKADWEKITAAYPHLAADIAKREKEIADGFAQYEGMRELRPYVEMARSRGQSLKQALDNYTGIEAALRDPRQSLNAVLHLANNAGYPPQRLAMELAPYLGSQPAQNGAPQLSATQTVDPSMFQQWLNPLEQKIQSIESLFQRQQEAEKQRTMTAISTVVERFKSVPEHRYYQNVEPSMTRLIESGVVPSTGDYAADLKAAYDMACWQDPEIRTLLISEQTAKTEAARVKAEKEAGEKARQASRSITGSPSSAVRETDDDKGGDSPFDAARAAYREVSARV
jgi:hypothetical protein